MVKVKRQLPAPLGDDDVDNTVRLGLLTNHTNRNNSNNNNDGYGHSHIKKDCDNEEKDHEHHVILMQHSRPTPKSPTYGTLLIRNISLPEQDLPVRAVSKSMSMSSTLPLAPFKSNASMKTTDAAAVGVVRVREKRCHININNNEAEAEETKVPSHPPPLILVPLQSPLCCQTTFKTATSTAVTTPPLRESLSGLILTSISKNNNSNHNNDADADVVATTPPPAARVPV
jgi:hypothetical protein